MIEQGLRAARMQVEKNLHIVEEAGHSEVAKTFRRQLRVIERLQSESETLLEAFQVPDIYPYNVTEELPSIQDAFEELYQAHPEVFPQQKELTLEEKTNLKAFASVVAWPTAITQALLRTDIDSPIKLYHLSEESVFATNNIGKKRAQTIFYALGAYYPQFRKELKNPPSKGQ